MTLIDYAVLLVYFAVMIAIGLWAMYRVKDQEDYFMGGRGFGKLLQTFAAFGAGTGSNEPVLVGRTCWTSGAERCLVRVDVAVRHAGLLDHCGLVSPHATPHAGRLVC